MLGYLMQRDVRVYCVQVEVRIQCVVVVLRCVCIDGVGVYYALVVGCSVQLLCQSGLCSGNF